MKKNNKGFVMAEAILVSGIVTVALILIYTQFISINNSYNKSFKYNTVSNLYSANEILKFLNTEDLNNIVNDLSSNNYVDLTSCSFDYVLKSDYCKALIEALNVKTLIISRENLTMLKSTLNDNNVFSESMYSFIKSINYKGVGGYRIIVEFNDDTFATLKIDGYISPVKDISNICIIQNSCEINDIIEGITMNVEVFDGQKYSFTVLNIENDYVDLIMNDILAVPDSFKNAYDSDKLYFTDLNSINLPYLYQIIENETKNWTNIALTYYEIPMYLYKNNTLTKYTSFKYLKARMPRESDFIVSGDNVSNNLDNRFYIEDVSYDNGLLTKEYNLNKFKNTNSSEIRPVIRLDKLTIKNGEVKE